MTAQRFPKSKRRSARRTILALLAGPRRFVMSQGVGAYRREGLPAGDVAAELRVPVGRITAIASGRSLPTHLETARLFGRPTP